MVSRGLREGTSEHQRHPETFTEAGQTHNLLEGFAESIMDLRFPNTVFLASFAINQSCLLARMSRHCSMLHSDDQLNQLVEKKTSMARIVASLIHQLMSAAYPSKAYQAMEIVTVALRTLLTKLVVLLTDEYKLQGSLRGEIMFLEAELETMQAALERISKAPVRDNQVRVWVRDVRELSYDIEDSIDIFMVRVRTCPSAMPSGFRGFINRAINLLTTANVRHRIATDIKSFRVLVKEVAGRHDRYKIESAAVAEESSINLDPRLQGMYEESTRLIGISSPREELTKMLLMGQESIRNPLIVIPIVGVGGLGKTTLANVMYQQLRTQFDCHAFVSVSLRPDLKRILSSILRQVTHQCYANIETWDIPELINNIRQFLEHKRYN
ncbi:hypothetical protein EJB05_27934, partial [Eragrostis curvula]